MDHRILAGVKEGLADCTRIDEVAAALTKMKRSPTTTTTTTITDHQSSFISFLHLEYLLVNFCV